MDGTSTQLDDELATILDALFRCTKVDLQIEDAQAGSPLSCADGGSPDFNRRSASEHPDDTSVGACEEEQRGSILQGEDLALLLTLKPVRGSLETEMSNAFGLCGPEDLQLECWNRLTACLFVSAQLVPCGPEYADDDLVVVKGRCCVGAPAADVPAACSRGLPQRLQPLQMAAVSTQGDCCPSVYRLGLKVEGQLTCAVSTRHFVRVEVELGSLTQLRRVFADMSDAAAGFSALCAEEQSMDVALAVTNLCCPPSDTDTDVLQQLSYNEFSSYGMLSSGSALMTLLKPTTVINPLKVEVRVTEPLPRYNCVQVSVSNPLTRTVRVQDLCVHLPTTTSVDDAADGSSPCIFSAKSGKDEASFRPHGFDAACRVECFMVGTETEVLPVVLQGGETYGFMFVIRPYDQSPETSGAASSPGGVADERPTLQCSRMSVLFSVEGLSSSFEKHATIRWKYQAKPPGSTTYDDRLAHVSTFVQPRMRRKHS